MNEAVLPELYFLFYSFAAGVISFFGYDILLAFRAFFSKHVLFEKITDVLYWLAASIAVFYGIYRKNDGIIRGYAVLGMVCGMVIYRRLLGERLERKTGYYAKKFKNCWKRWLQPLQIKKKELQKKRKQSKINRKSRRKSPKGLERG